MQRSSTTRVAITCAAILFALHCNSNAEDLNDVVISCEEAFARLEECCPGFKAEVSSSGGGEFGHRCHDVTYSKSTQGCEGKSSSESGHVLPSLSLSESECVRGTSCEDLRARKVCDRARDADARGSGQYTSTDPLNNPETVSGSLGGDHPAVCP